MDQEDQIPDFMREDKIDLSSMAPDDKIKRAAELAQKYVELNTKIKEMEDITLPSWKKEREELARRQLPDMFESLGTDKVGVPDANVDVVIQPYVHANIKTDWPEDQRRAAFDHLKFLGVEDIIAVELSVKFTRGEIELARELQQLIMKSKFGNTHPPKFEMGTPWNTLTATLKSILEDAQKAKTVDLEKLGATVGRTAAIKKRKSK
jgi:hypothetical protein